MSDREKDDQEIVNNAIIASGASLGGHAVGAAGGAFLGGPAGAAAGAFFGGLVQIGADVLRRKISERQITRVGTLLDFVMNTISARIMNGETLRQDGLLENTDREYSHYSEMLEELLRATTETIEERKIPFMANMFANFVLEDDYQVYKMRDLIRRVEDLSFLQLMLLVVFADEAKTQEPKLRWIGNQPFAGRALDIITERYRLQDLNITEIPMGADIGEDNSLPSPQLTTLGKQVHRLMELSTIPEDDINSLKSELICLDVCRESGN